MTGPLGMRRPECTELQPSAARGLDGLAGEPCGVIGGEERGHGGDVVRLADAAERRICGSFLLEVAAHDAGSMSAFRLNHSGVKGVDADLARAQFL